MSETTNLTPYEEWMVRQNVAYAATEGAEVIVARLHAGGYHRVAAAVFHDQGEEPVNEYKGYDVKDGRVVSPGKFEGERIEVIDAYEQWMDGFADDNGNVISAEIERSEFAEKGGPLHETIRFVINDQGFVCEVR